MGTIDRGLPTGDYTLDGFETRFVIERKATTGEISQNIYEARFKRELERLQDFEHPFIIMEFTIDDILKFPLDSGIPAYLWKKIRTTPSLLLAKIMELQLTYRTKFVFAGGNGKRVAACLLKRMTELYDKE